MLVFGAGALSMVGVGVGVFGGGRFGVIFVSVFVLQIFPEFESLRVLRFFYVFMLS